MNSPAVGILILGFFAYILIHFFSKKNQQEKMAAEAQAEVEAILPETFVVFDLETTGLNAGKHEIIEIGAIRVHPSRNVHESFQTLVKPTKRIPHEIVDLTGITQEMVDRDGGPLLDALRGFEEFAGNLRLVSYNAEFDMAFLNAGREKCGMRPVKNPVSCALKMARRALPGRKSYRLQELTKNMDIGDLGNHRALGDCRRALLIYSLAATQLHSVR